ncbi:MAG: DedA family protein [Rhodothermales bacterium]|nr:DedA family protein [Rhodothermales bacterium]MCA0268606.1 DedA family protein [Bacteroidota bacterium]
MEMLADLYAWLSGLSPLAVYAVLFAFSYAENVFPPVPGDVALVVGGMLAGIGVVHLPVLVVVCTVSGLVGFMTVYGIGRKVGPALLDPDRYRWVPKDQLRKAEASVNRHGRGIVLANRFLPGLRSVIGLAVGMSGVPVQSTVLLATVSAAAWSLLLCGLGYALGDNREALARALSNVKMGGLVLMGVLALVGLGYYVRGVRRRAATHAHDLPPPPAPIDAAADVS